MKYQIIGWTIVTITLLVFAWVWGEWLNDKHKNKTSTRNNRISKNNIPKSRRTSGNTIQKRPKNIRRYNQPSKNINRKTNRKRKSKVKKIGDDKMKTTSKELKDLIRKKIEERWNELKAFKEKEANKKYKNILQEYSKLAKEKKLLENRRCKISDIIRDKLDAYPNDDATINFDRY